MSPCQEAVIFSGLPDSIIDLHTTLFTVHCITHQPAIWDSLGTLQNRSELHLRTNSGL